VPFLLPNITRRAESKNGEKNYGYGYDANYGLKRVNTEVILPNKNHKHEGDIEEIVELQPNIINGI